MKLDDIDHKILIELQRSGRESASHIAEKINVTVPTITERIRKLQDSDVITGFQAVVDPSKLGLDVSAIITVISGSSQFYKEVTIEAEKTSEVVQCFSTTGNGSHTLLVTTKNSNTLEELLRKIQSWPGVARTETQIILSSYKNGIIIPVGDG
ncbi:MAG: Lrp/AsnC family transcriptional regulator [Candidatus Marinimicrobia bacterium]|jgi:Lrp/AsnC family leucine-responsive transcriptional regulator|nr:Lrp/AsnC family transcriptional regulator [Candidatus Neomarinimicrobiota bacterium]|tara:strand:+ start:12857 stop:13315 length:459 start_codon:yes stop_codon:yes gene_type:complete